MKWLRGSRWHYCLRLPCDVLIHTSRRYPTLVGALYPPLGEARLYQNVGLWLDGVHRCNLVLATVQGAKESWAVITDEPPRQADPLAIRFEVPRGRIINGIASPGRLSWKTLACALPLL